MKNNKSPQLYKTDDLVGINDGTTALPVIVSDTISTSDITEHREYIAGNLCNSIQEYKNRHNNIEQNSVKRVNKIKDSIVDIYNHNDYSVSLLNILCSV